MPRLTAAKILAAEDYPRTEIDVPEWGGTLNLKVHSLRDTIELEESADKFAESFYCALYLSFSIVDDEGRRQFATTEAINGLAERHPGVLLRLFNLAVGLNKGEDAKAREKHEEAAPPEGLPAGGAIGQDGG